jgi:hypothetical protein
MPPPSLPITLEPSAFEALRALTEEAGYKSPSSTIRECLRVVKALHDQAKLGLTEIVVRDTKSKTEKVMLLPLFQPERQEWTIAEGDLSSPGGTAAG